MAAQGPEQPAVDAVIAHRGASGSAPENTLASLARAADLGCGWVEFDCQLTRDREIVLLHDDDLKRTAGDPRDVHQVDLAEIRKLDAGGWFAADFAGEPIPTLDQALGLLRRTGMGAALEIKAGNDDPRAVATAVAEFVTRRWPAELPLPVLCSFSEPILETCAAVAPSLPRGIGFWEVPADWDAQARRFGCSAIHANHDFLDPDTARAMIAAGYALRAYTVNDAARAAALFDLGVHSVFTDHPERINRR